jgi:hypothetical protein
MKKVSTGAARQTKNFRGQKLTIGLDLLEDRFRGSGYRVGRIMICANCCGIDIDWCR